MPTLPRCYRGVCAFLDRLLHSDGHPTRGGPHVTHRKTRSDWWEEEATRLVYECAQRVFANGPTSDDRRGVVVKEVERGGCNALSPFEVLAPFDVFRSETQMIRSVLMRQHKDAIAQGLRWTPSSGMLKMRFDGR